MVDHCNGRGFHGRDNGVLTAVYCVRDNAPFVCRNRRVNVLGGRLSDVSGFGSIIAFGGRELFGGFKFSSGGCLRVTGGADHRGTHAPIR